MLNIIKYITLSLYHIIKYTNLLSLRINDFLLTNKLKLLLLCIGVEVKSVEYYNFFCLKWAELEYLPLCIGMLTQIQKIK